MSLTDDRVMVHSLNSKEQQVLADCISHICELLLMADEKTRDAVEWKALLAAITPAVELLHGRAMAAKGKKQ